MFVGVSYSDSVVVDIRNLNKTSQKDDLNGRYAFSIEKFPDSCKKTYPPCDFELWYCYNSRIIEVKNIVAIIEPAGHTSEQRQRMLKDVKIFPKVR